MKARANEVAMQVLPYAREIVESSADPFRTAVIVSIVGNNFDYGVQGHRVVEKEFRDFLQKKVEEGLKIDDTERIKELSSGKVVYLTDNAGEIFFDTLLMEEIKRWCRKLTGGGEGEANY